MNFRFSCSFHARLHFHASAIFFFVSCSFMNFGALSCLSCIFMLQPGSWADFRKTAWQIGRRRENHGQSAAFHSKEAGEREGRMPLPKHPPDCWPLGQQIRLLYLTIMRHLLIQPTVYLYRYFEVLYLYCNRFSHITFNYRPLSESYETLPSPCFSKAWKAFPNPVPITNICK